MKKLSLFWVYPVVVLCVAGQVEASAATQTKPSSQSPPPPKEPPPAPPTASDELAHTQKEEKDSGQQAVLLADVTVSGRSFNPSKGEETGVYYSLSRKAQVEVAFYDPDFALVRRFASDALQEAGKHAVVWDGKDLDGTVVPDEAYFFTITASDEQGQKEVYDPSATSGGEGADITQADIDPYTKVITYKLPAMARVLIRLGVQDGPLLKTLVDWKPRVAGAITEHWNGKDEDNVIDLLDHPRFKMLVTYFALPEHSIITYGNKDMDYRRYKGSLKPARPVKERPDRADVMLSPHYQLPRTVDYSPRLALSFSDIKDKEKGDIPVLKDKTLVKIDIDDENRSFFINQQYEITLFLDTEFYTEQEIGYIPFNWVWDLSDVPAGEHVLTVNLSGFKDQIGVISKRIKVAE